MTALSAAATAARALDAIGSSNTPGYCLAKVYEWFGSVPSIGPGSGHYDTAMDGWNYATDKHPGDLLPPVGAPVYFGVSPTRTDANRAAGDVTISLGGGLLAATDYPVAGVVGTVTIAERARQTERPYLGWTGDFLGHSITFGGIAEAGLGATPLDPTTPTPVGELMATRIIRTKAEVKGKPNAYHSYLANPDTMKALHLGTSTQESYWKNLGVPFSAAVQPPQVLAGFEIVAGKGPAK